MQQLRRILFSSYARLVALVVIILAGAVGVAAPRQQLLDDQIGSGINVTSTTPDSCKWCGGE